MSQESRPVSDVITGGWLPTPVFSEINEPSPDDASFVSSPGTETGDTFEVKLGPLYAPVDGTQTLTVRVRKTGEGSTSAWVSLVQSDGDGPESIITARQVDLSNTFTDRDLVLTSQEIASITNYGLLRVRITAITESSSSSSGSSGSGVTVPGCSNPIPFVLFATFSGAVAELGTVMLTYSGGTWTGTAEGCGGTVDVTFANTGSNAWSLLLTDAQSAGAAGTAICSPFYFDGTLATTGGGCAFGGGVTITETSP